MLNTNFRHEIEICVNLAAIDECTRPIPKDEEYCDSGCCESKKQIQNEILETDHHEEPAASHDVKMSMKKIKHAGSCDAGSLGTRGDCCTTDSDIATKGCNALQNKDKRPRCSGGDCSSIKDIDSPHRSPMAPSNGRKVIS